MRVSTTFLILFCVSICSFSFSFAEECNSARITDTQSGAFIKCYAWSMTPTYFAGAEISAPAISPLECTLFCENKSVVPVPHFDHVHVQLVDRSEINWILAARRAVLRRLPDAVEVPPEKVIQEYYSSRLSNNPLYEETEIENPLIRTSWQMRPLRQQLARRSQPVPVAPLSENQVVAISKEDLAEDENCPICLEPLQANQTGEKRAIQTPCKLTQTHRFHFKCIGDWYINTQKCPLCRDPIPLVQN